MHCPRCTSTQLANTLFCDVCGQEMSATPDALRAGQTVFLVDCIILENGRVLRLPERPEVLFGRAEPGTGPLVDVDLNPFGAHAAGVSRRHARLHHFLGELSLEDLSSLNGTFVNGKRLTPQRHTRIRAGDTIRLGLLRLTFRVQER